MSTQANTLINGTLTRLRHLEFPTSPPGTATSTASLTSVDGQLLLIPNQET